MDYICTRRYVDAARTVQGDEMANETDDHWAWDAAIRTLLDDTGSLFFAYDVDEPNLLRAVSGSITTLTGYEPDELVGTPIHDLIVQEETDTHNTPGSGLIEGDVRLRRIDGSPVWIRTKSRLSLVDGKPQLVGLGIVIDALKRREDALHALLATDRLTGLLSRDEFVERTDAELDRGAQIIVGIIDLDGFRQLNNTLGHHAGDKVLQVLGQRLGFLVNERLIIARLGGDEFGLLMTGEWSEDDVRAVARRLSETIAEPIDIDGIEVQSRASIGLARSVFGVASAEIMRQGEVAMYEAKRSKTGTALYYEECDHPQTRRDLTVISTLRRSLEDELELHYQPVIDLWTGETVAVEGLARWQHPERGLLYPGEFLPAIELGGLSERLDLWAIEAASKIGSMRTHSGARLKISVNVTADGLLSLRILPRIRRLLETGAITGEQLILEISERNVQDDLHKVKPVLEELRSLGVGISLDDFGTGFSSLTRLRDLPFTEVKMDRSFVSKMIESEADREIVRATVHLGRALGLTVVAEGVETKAIADGAGALGCSFAQGKFYASAMPVSELISKGLIVRPAVAAA